MEKKRSVVKVIAISVFLLTIDAGYSQNPNGSYDEAVKYGAQGEFEAAHNILKNLPVDNQPNYITEKHLLKLTDDIFAQKVEKEAALHIFKGVAYDRERGAIKYTPQELMKMVEGPQDTVTKGTILRDKAIAEYKKAIAINPNIAAAHLGLGNTYGHGEPEKAIAEYKKAIALDPEDGLPHFCLAYLYHNKGMLNEAKEELEKAIELGIKPIFLKNAHKFLSTIKEKLKNPSKTRAVFAETNIPAKDAQLIQAAKDGNLSTVQTLLAQGADINAKGKYGTTALMDAVRKGHTKIVEVLLANGADVNAKDDKLGSTALMSAAMKGHTETVEALLAKGADVNAKDKDGFTALTFAAFSGNTKTVEVLLAQGADVDAKDKDGETALMLATQMGHTEIAEALSAKGANANAKYTMKEILLIIIILILIFILIVVLVGQFTPRVGVIIFGSLFIIFPVSNMLLAVVWGYHYTPLQNYTRGFVALFCILTGIGILLLKEWARKLAVIFPIVAIIVSLSSFFIIHEIIFKNNSNLIVNIWTFIYGSLLLCFFTRRRTKEQFKHNLPPKTSPNTT
jgi:ankyrin repeat protein